MKDYPAAAREDEKIGVRLDLLRFARSLARKRRIGRFWCVRASSPLSRCARCAPE